MVVGRTLAAPTAVQMQSLTEKRYWLVRGNIGEAESTSDWRDCATRREWQSGSVANVFFSSSAGLELVGLAARRAHAPVARIHLRYGHPRPGIDVRPNRGRGMRQFVHARLLRRSPHDDRSTFRAALPPRAVVLERLRPKVKGTVTCPRPFARPPDG
jgi:hypothetical protein